MAVAKQEFRNAQISHCYFAPRPACAASACDGSSTGDRGGNKATGQVFYDADGSGAGAMVLFAVLSNHVALTAANIWVFDL